MNSMVIRARLTDLLWKLARRLYALLSPCQPPCGHRHDLTVTSHKTAELGAQFQVRVNRLQHLGCSAAIGPNVCNPRPLDTRVYGHVLSTQYR